MSMNKKPYMQERGLKRAPFNKNDGGKHSIYLTNLRMGCFSQWRTKRLYATLFL